MCQCSIDTTAPLHGLLLIAKCVTPSPPQHNHAFFFCALKCCGQSTRAYKRCELTPQAAAATHRNHAPRRRPAPGPQHLPEQASGGRRRREDPLRHGRHEI